MPIGTFCYPPAMRITVVGAGYVGLVTGVCLARRGEHHVTLVETAPNRLRELQAGGMPIEEPGLAEAFAESRERITVVGSLDQVEDPDLVFLAVGTPISDTGEPDLSQLQSATADLRRWPDVDVSVRSTLPPGLSVRLPKLLGRADGARVSTNPEFLRQGSAVHDYEHPSRIIFGRFAETTDAHLAVVERVYAAIEAPRLHVDVAAAELIKNVANGFLALKLSFVNEVAALSEEYGVEVTEVLDGIGLDPRIGSVYMRPGLGFGGSCLPKELQVLAAAGRRRGLSMHVARAISQVNVEQQDRFVRQILAEIPRDESRVGLLGLSFKADTDDLRGSPALHVARRLLEEGVVVTAHDPAVRPDRAVAAAPGLQIASRAEDVFEGADAVAIATEWPQFATLPLPRLRDRTRQPILFDGRGIIAAADAVAAGFHYRGVGRQPRSPIVVEAR
ncbi:MAG: rkpK [Chloroflexota bacterium]|nr:rkpK [Chloroflexota bacterium]